jgi:hypothetical protein
VSLVVDLGRRFVRGRQLPYSALTVGVAAAFLVTAYMTLHALSLTTAQRVEQSLGRFSSSIDLGGVVADIKPGRHTPVDRLTDAAERAGVPDIDIELNSFDVQTVRNGSRAFYAERDWTAAPFPARYALTAGRWPERAGEVALTNPHELGVDALGKLEVFSGRASFDVVGFAGDRYGVFPQLLAAPGTWATLDRRLEQDFPAALATPRIYSSTLDPRRMARIALAVSGRRSDDLAATAPKGETRATLARNADAVWFQRLPAAYRVPAVLLPLLAVLLMIGLNDRWLRARMLVLTDAGVPRPAAAYGLMAAVAAVALVAVGAGTALGWLLALAARPALAAVHPLPLSPPVIPVMPALNVLAMLFVGWLAALAAVCFGSFERRERTAGLRGRSRRWRDVRQLAALSAAGVAVVLTTQLRTAAETMVLAAFVAVAAVLVTPELVGWTAARLRESSYVELLAKRQLIADRRRGTLVAAILTVSLGLPLGFLTLLDTTLATEQSERLPEVGQGQLYLSSVGGLLTPPSRGVHQIVTDELGTNADPVRLGYLASRDGSRLVTASGLDGTFILTVDDVADAAALLGHPLSPAESATLLDGGLLAWDASARAQRLTVTDGADASGTLDVASRATPRPHAGWTQGIQGLTLASTARARHLPHSHGGTFYSGLADEQAVRARRAVVAAGFDGEQVTIYEKPAAVVPRAAQAAAAIGLAALVIGIGLAVARAQVAALRRYLGALLAIGVPPTWPRRVLLTQLAVIVGVGTALALVVALPPVVAAAWLVPDVVLSVPWTSLAAVVATVYASMALVTVFAARSLRP